MVSKRVRLDPKTSSKSKSTTADPTPRLAVFGQPLLLEGEDPAAYDQLLARICAAVKPVDIIDEIFIADAVFSEWDVLRLCRLKWSLIRALALVALEEFLGPKLDYDLYSEDLAHEVANILQDNLPEDQAEDAQTLAREIAQDEADAFDKVQKILGGIGLNIKRVRDEVRDNKAKELVQEYVRHESNAVTLVDELLSRSGESMDNFMAEALVEETRRYRADRSPNHYCREPPQRQPARDRPATGGARRIVATERARDRGGRVRSYRGDASQRKKRGLTSDQKIQANRANAQASTGPKTAQGRTRSARNALRHALSLPVCSNPALSEEVKLAREIAGPGANAKTQQLARRVAEPQIDLRRVRYARHITL